MIENKAVITKKQAFKITEKSYFQQFMQFTEDQDVLFNEQENNPPPDTPVQM